MSKFHSNILVWPNKTADKSDNMPSRDKSKDIGERKKAQKIPRQGQAIQKKNRTFQNNERKFYKQGENAQEQNNTRIKRKQRNFKVKRNGKNISEKLNRKKITLKKELQGFEDGLDVDIHRELHRATLKKIPNRKTPAYDGLDGL